MESTNVLHIQSGEFFTKWTYGKVEAEMFSPPWRSEHVQRNLTGNISAVSFMSLLIATVMCYHSPSNRLMKAERFSRNISGQENH